MPKVNKNMTIAEVLMINRGDLPFSCNLACTA